MKKMKTMDVLFRLEKNETPEQFADKLKSKIGTEEDDIFLVERFVNIPAPFDLLCYGKRVSFDFGRAFRATGIFPFKEDDIYIELTESAETLRENADESHLPGVGLCEGIYEIRNKLNRRLKKLGVPLLEGEYFAVGMAEFGTNWIVGFSGNEECMPVDCFNNGKKAKIRYVKMLK